MNYYLLMFNEDWADEHSVPALAVMNEKEFDTWKMSHKGTLRPEYEEEMKLFNAFKEAKKNIDLECKRVLGDNWGSKRFDTWPEELRERYQNLPSKFGFKNSFPNHPQKIVSNLHAYLGNSGQCFEEDYSHLLTGEDFIEVGMVSIVEIDESFYTTAKKAKLSNLSLCNIFDL